MVNIRLSNSVPNIKVFNTVPNLRTSNFQTAESSASFNVSVGVPIGLLLSLTYAVSSSGTVSQFFGERPNIRIKND